MQLFLADIPQLCPPPTSWGLQHNPGFNFTASRNGSWGLHSGTPLTHAWPQQLVWKIPESLYSCLFSDSKARTMGPRGWCCQLLLPAWDGLSYTFISFPLLHRFSFSLVGSLAGWGLALGHHSHYSISHQVIFLKISFCTSLDSNIKFPGAFSPQTVVYIWQTYISQNILQMYIHMHVTKWSSSLT